MHAITPFRHACAALPRSRRDLQWKARPHPAPPSTYWRSTEPFGPAVFDTTAATTSRLTARSCSAGTVTACGFEVYHRHSPCSPPRVQDCRGHAWFVGGTTAVPIITLLWTSLSVSRIEWAMPNGRVGRQCCQCYHRRPRSESVDARAWRRRTHSGCCLPHAAGLHGSNVGAQKVESHGSKGRVLQEHPSETPARAGSSAAQPLLMEPACHLDPLLL